MVPKHRQGLSCGRCRVEATPQERFGWYYTAGPGAECWEWRGSRLAGGYGVFLVERKQLGAHRYAWIVAQGAIPDGLHVLHTCDNRGCVNPAHLFLGTHRDNMDDCTRKGRRPSGPRHWSARVMMAEGTA